jgi:ABC-type multidrug transport system permease subunit
MSSATPILHPMLAVAKARLIEFIREPEAVFWVYIFPLLMILVLGLAFRNQPPQALEFDIVDAPQAHLIIDQLKLERDVTINVFGADECRLRLRTGKAILVLNVVKPDLNSEKSQPNQSQPNQSQINGDLSDSSGQQSTSAPANSIEELQIEYWFDPTRPESPGLRREIDDRLQRLAGRRDVWQTRDVDVQETGGRYIDFLVPGLIGMGLMGGGLWGVGFAIVDLRLRKLLKRFLATPMRRGDFLGGVMISRMLFMVPEILMMLVFSWVLFGVRIQGNWLLLVGIVLLGAVQFSGIGLLVASRCKTLESASGLMNLVMLPMWTLCGIFFSWEKFPEIFHPVIRCLPLTPLIDSLRAVVNDGAGLATVWPELSMMLAWAVVSCSIALRIFRWKDA